LRVFFLFLSLFLLFLLLFVSDALADSGQKLNGVRDWFSRFAVPVLAAVAAFILGTLLCRTPLAGVVWGVMGWLIPGWAGLIVTERKRSTLRGDAKAFIAAASGLYASGQVTPEVVKAASKMFPDPLAGDFQSMIGRRSADKNASFPSMFEGLAAKYDLPEFKALASIIGGSEHAGGPRAAAAGLRELAASLRSRDRRLAERRKETLQPMIAAGVVIILILIGFVFDVTSLSRYYASFAGEIMLSGASLLLLIAALAISKVVTSKDLTGGA
jgi:tight adherence protein B